MAAPYVLHGQTDIETLAGISASRVHVKQLIAGKTVKAKKGYSLGNAVAIGLAIFVLISLMPFLFLIPLRLLGF